MVFVFGPPSLLWCCSVWCHCKQLQLSSWNSHETLRIDSHWLRDRGTKFARWQHPAVSAVRALLCLLSFVEMCFTQICLLGDYSTCLIIQYIECIHQLPDSFRQPHHSCLDSPPHPLLNSSLVIIPTLVIHHSFSLSLPAQNLPFQQILPTVDFFYLLDCLTITGLDRTYYADHFIFSFTF